MQTAPSDPDARLAWLIDRIEISDLLIEYARAVDEQDWPAFGEVWTEDVSLTVPGIEVRGRRALVDWAENADYGMASYAATHHINCNHAVEIDGDTATGRAYVLSAHLREPDPRAEPNLGAGWWDYTFRREDGRWRCASAHLTVKWLGVGGSDLPMEP